MASWQQPAPGSKSAKFINVHPLDPFIRPFEKDEGVIYEESDRNSLAENLNRRLEDHVLQRQIQAQYHTTATGTMTNPNSAVTSGYSSANSLDIVSPALKKNFVDGFDYEEDDTEESDDDDDDIDDDDDPVLQALRIQRLEKLRDRHCQQHQKEDGRHFGEVRTISQDEFLPECLNCSTSPFVVVHFFHSEFERCRILDHHLRKIAMHSSTTCKCVRIDAEKAPFFVSKLTIRTLPTLLVFEHGVVKNRLVGFDGLVSTTSDPDQWKTCQLQAWLRRTGAIHYNSDDDDCDEDDDEDADDDRRPSRIYNHRHRALYSNHKLNMSED